MENKKIKYLILGGGVSGISTAVFLGKDEDYIHLGNTILDDDENLIHSHNQYGIDLYEPNYEEIILNANYHFFYKGVKFVSPEIIKNLKIKRNEPKDVLDINLINSIK